MSAPTHTQLILASSSPYRKILLERLLVPFSCHAPNIDETPLLNETAAETSKRLAIAKARVLADHYPSSLIIGSDQVALLFDTQIGKPGSHDHAVKQLQNMRGQEVIFHTAVCLYNTATQQLQTAIVKDVVVFRDYSDEEIARYLQKEKPYHCAASTQIEALGITMVASVNSTDPTSLIGLPLITLTAMLKKEGVLLP